jgi:hypothetical protein
MPRVLTVDGSVKIGAYRFPDRKKPCLCVEKGNVCTVYGSFIDTDRANEFMNELAALVKKEIAEYDPYWKPCIILNVDN